MIILSVNWTNAISFLIDAILLVKSCMFVEEVFKGSLRLNVIPENIIIILALNIAFTSVCFIIYFSILYFRRVIQNITAINIGLSDINDRNQLMSERIIGGNKQVLY